MMVVMVMMMMSLIMIVLLISFVLDYHDHMIQRYSVDCNEEKGTIIHHIININEIMVIGCK